MIHNLVLESGPNFRWQYSWHFTPSTNPRKFTTENGKYAEIYQNIPVEVDIDELIEQIIISPYAETYDVDIVRSVAAKYGFDSKKIVKSPININP